MSLSESQQQMVNTFQEITQLNDNELCTNILQQNNWNLQGAVDNYVNGVVVGNNNSSTSSSINETNGVNGQGSFDSSNQASNNQSWIVSIIWSPLKWVFYARPSTINPELDTRLYVNDFNREYGFIHPTFQISSYQNAVQQAYRQHKFLLVYIHSPMHEDTQDFCESSLCTESVSRYVDENMVFWSGRVWDTEAYSLSIQLKASTFPFLAVLVCQSERIVQVVNRIQGVEATTEAQLLERLTTSVTQSSHVINRIRTEITRREETASLREQQDREYREAEETDRRERERRIREKEEKRLSEEAALQAQELQEAVELSQRLSYEASIHRKKESLPSEPIDNNHPDTATIRFQLPTKCTTSKITRKFHRTDRLEHVENYLSVYFYESGTNVKNFSLSTHFPKQELTDLTATVESVGLHPRGMLYVNDIDA